MPTLQFYQAVDKRADIDIGVDHSQQRWAMAGQEVVHTEHAFLKRLVRVTMIQEQVGLR
jgi:hypothetical protein